MLPVYRHQCLAAYIAFAVSEWVCGEAGMPDLRMAAYSTAMRFAAQHREVLASMTLRVAAMSMDAEVSREAWQRDNIVTFLRLSNMGILADFICFPPHLPTMGVEVGGRSFSDGSRERLAAARRLCSFVWAGGPQQLTRWIRRRLRTMLCYEPAEGEVLSRLRICV